VTASDGKAPRILVVGPLPPPLAGTSVSFQAFCDEVQRCPDRVQLDVINSAPKQLGKTGIFTAAKFATASHIFSQFFRRIRQADQALIFSNDQFLISMVPLCLTVAKLAGKPCYIRMFGGSLDSYYGKRSRLQRWFMRWFMRRAAGLIVQTELLHQYFTELLGDKVHLVPGYRPVPESSDEGGSSVDANQVELRLVFLGHVREEKGVFVLLDALRRLNESQPSTVRCDIYGPVYPEISERFDAEMARTANASYKGGLEPNDVIPTLKQYNALVFPSHFSGEGHPGVLIEAMMAGLAIVTTSFRSIPEIVQHRVNGLLVPPQNAEELADAVRQLADDRQLLAELAQNGCRLSRKHTAEDVVPRILQPMGIIINEHV
jgi:glycosyltransferase involved in cell wall biosynthesis